MRAVAVKAKELRYAVDLTATGELTDENGVALDPPAEWSPEHMLLAALIRCSLKSLRYHAKPRGVEVRSTSGSSPEEMSTAWSSAASDEVKST